MLPKLLLPTTLGLIQKPPARWNWLNITITTIITTTITGVDIITIIITTTITGVGTIITIITTITHLSACLG